MDQCLFLGEDRWGPISPEQAETVAAVNHTIYQCGRCSGDGIVVYHNVFGVHRHVTKEQLKEFLSYLPDVI